MAVWNAGDVDFQPDTANDPDGSGVAFAIFCCLGKGNAGGFGGTANPFDHITATTHTTAVEGTLAGWTGCDLWVPCLDDSSYAACPGFAWRCGARHLTVDDCHHEHHSAA